MSRSGNSVVRLWTSGVAFLIAAVLAGCAHQSATSRIDVESLLNAIAIDDAGHLRGLVDSGQLSVDTRVPAPGYPDGTPLITLAARDGALATLRYLISAGADVNAPTPVGETALMLAAFFPSDERDAPLQQRYEEAVRLLLDAGANVDNRPHHYTALSYAAYQNRLRIVRFLLARGAKVDGDVSGGITYVNTPLMMAAIQGHYDTAVSLLRAGANPRIRVHRGHTAAELAAKYKHMDLAQVLQCAQSLRAGETFEARCR
ncbi:MAG: ankyrin repeat domain-containing protein [Methanocella sp.]